MFQHTDPGRSDEPALPAKTPNPNHGRREVVKKGVRPAFLAPARGRFDIDPPVFSSFAMTQVDDCCWRGVRTRMSSTRYAGSRRCWPLACQAYLTTQLQELKALHAVKPSKDDEWRVIGYNKGAFHDQTPFNIYPALIRPSRANQLSRLSVGTRPGLGTMMRRSPSAALAARQRTRCDSCTTRATWNISHATRRSWRSLTRAPCSG